MREILFRGFHPDEDGDSKEFVNGEWINGFWVYGDLIQLHDGRMFIVNSKFGACIDEYGNFINTEYPFVCVVIPKTVGQYTGLKDKNGKKIFEGDILRHSKNQKTMSVVWDGVESQFVWQKRKGNNKYLFNSGSLFLTNRYFEIVGNIYENPELLENKK